MILLTKHADFSSCVRLFGPEPDTGRNRELILGLMKKLSLDQCAKMRIWQAIALVQYLFPF